jgi:ketosteroid isomerase-like protein
MTVHHNVQLLRNFFVANGRGDKAALAEYFTTDARWWAPISAEQRGLVRRPLEGRAEVLELLTTFVTRLYGPERTWTIQHVTADTETGAAHVELVTTLAGSGQPYRNTYAFFYQFVNGQIADVWEFTDTEYSHGQFEEEAARQASSEGNSIVLSTGAH